MHWGSGSAVGLLTLLGYGSFLVGAALAWRGRADIFAWVHDELGAYRQTLSPHEPLGPFYSRRGRSRFKRIPYQFLRTLSCIPRSRYRYGAFLLVLGPLLVLLDLFL